MIDCDCMWKWLSYVAIVACALLKKEKTIVYSNPLSNILSLLLFFGNVHMQPSQYFLCSVKQWVVLLPCMNVHQSVGVLFASLPLKSKIACGNFSEKQGTLKTSTIAFFLTGGNNVITNWGWFGAKVCPHENKNLKATEKNTNPKKHQVIMSWTFNLGKTTISSLSAMGIHLARIELATFSLLGWRHNH